jgi:hypothetical protein
MREIRHSSALAAAGLGVTALLLLAAAHSWTSSRHRAGELEAQAALVRRLGLTDLCLFTDARYTRHPSQADHFTPFQDHPSVLEHFPSGSIAGPPPREGGP